MKSTIICISFLIVVSFHFGCSDTNRIYASYDKGKLIAGILSDSGINTLKNIIKFYSNGEIRDTIIIKYEYNNESCWDILDQHGDDYIRGIIKSKQSRIYENLKHRNNISVLTFREEGTNFNKVIAWDSTIIVDNNHRLYDLLFFDRSICGNSIIILPDKRYILTRSDSHFSSLSRTKKQIVATF